jgi:hypothetical protein
MHRVRRFVYLQLYPYVIVKERIRRLDHISSLLYGLLVRSGMFGVVCVVKVGLGC